ERCCFVLGQDPISSLCPQTTPIKTLLADSPGRYGQGDSGARGQVTGSELAGVQMDSALATSFCASVPECLGKPGWQQFFDQEGSAWRRITSGSIGDSRHWWRPLLP